MATTLTEPAPRTLKLFARPTFDPRALRQTYSAHAFEHEQAAFVAGHGVGEIRLDGGRLFVDEIPVLRPHMSHESLSWRQQAKGTFTAGNLWFARGGTELHGTVYRGTSSADATEHHVLATTIQPVAYDTRITTAREPDGTDPSTLPDSAWQTGLTLEIGYEMSTGDSAPTPVVCLNGEDVSDMTSWTIDDKTQQTVLMLALDPSIVCSLDPSLYLTGRIAFDQYKPLPTFSGTVSATCADQTGTGAYLWTGAARASADGAAAPRPAAASPEPLELTAEHLEDDPSLSIAELMSIVPDSSVSDTANNMLLENMKWAMGQDSTEKGWLEMFTGEEPPVLSPDRQNVAAKSTTWYQQQFAKAYFGWGFTNYSGPNAPSVNLDDGQKLKLKYFLQTGMAKDPDFNLQQNGIYLQAFVGSKPRLQAYLADGGEKWAQQLYGVVTSPPQITLMVNRIFGTGGLQGAMTPANNFATLLSALEGPAGPLAKNYIQMVTTAVLTQLAHMTTWQDQGAVMEWLPAFLQTFLDQVATNQSLPDEAKIVAQQIHDMAQQLGGQVERVAEEAAAFVLNANGANILEKTQNAEIAFVKKWPQFQKVGQMLFFAAWCVGVVMVVKAFQNWKDLTPEQKGEAVLEAVSLGLSAVDVFPPILSGLKSMGLAGWQKFTAWRFGPEAQDQVADMNKLQSGEDFVENAANETTPLLDASTQTIKTAGTTWETVFATASKVVAIVGVVISAAFAVLSTYTFIKDILDGAPITQEVFDGIMAVTNIAMTVCLILDLVLATTVFAIAAAVLAIVGLVIALIEMFVVKPENPLDAFMKSTVIPFVDGLPAQTPPPAPGGTTVRVALA
jgi:hypothetical protein